MEEEELFLSVGELIPQLCRLHYERAQSLFRALGLWRGQPAILGLLWEQDGRTQGELVAALGLRPPTVTKMLRRMEGSGFISRAPDPDDRRLVRVYLTPAGRAIREAVDAIRRQLAQESLAGLSEEELRLLGGLLRRMCLNLQRHFPGQRPCCGP